MKRLSVLFSLLTLFATIAAAEPAKAGYYLDQSVAAEYNPLGLQLGTKFYYRIPLIKSSNILWESTKIDIGLQNNFTPSYDYSGVFVSIEPIAIFNLVLKAQVAGFYKGLGFGFYSLSGYNAGFDDAALASLTPGNATGYLLSASPTLKAQFGPIAVLDTGNITYYNVDGGNGYFYDRTGNVVLGKGDSELSNDAYLMYQLTPEILAGLNDYLVYVPGSGYLSHRVDVVGVYSGTFGERTAPYAALLLGTYLTDRYLVNAIYVALQVGATLHL